MYEPIIEIPEGPMTILVGITSLIIGFWLYADIMKKKIAIWAQYEHDKEKKENEEK
jgi:hypothetical protein